MTESVPDSGYCVHRDTRPAAPRLPAGDDGLILRHVTVAYGRKVVLDDIGTEVHRGQVVGVIGPNGGGKSTLLQAILGLVPLVRGTITLFGRPSAAQRTRIAYVPQREVVDWEFPVTVREVVLMGRYVHTGWLRRPGREDHVVVDRMLDRVGLQAQATTQIGRSPAGSNSACFSRGRSRGGRRPVARRAAQRDRRDHPGGDPGGDRGAADPGQDRRPRDP